MIKIRRVWVFCGWMQWGFVQSAYYIGLFGQYCWRGGIWFADSFLTEFVGCRGFWLDRAFAFAHGATGAEAHRPQKKHVYGLGSVPQQHPNGPDPAVNESNILGSPSSPYQNKNLKKKTFAVLILTITNFGFQLV